MNSSLTEALQGKEPGKILILNGAPRSGKSTLAKAVQEEFPGIWLNIGVDTTMSTLPKKILPGIGLRPGKERPDLEESILPLYLGMYQNIAQHSRLGFNVVTDVGHHNSYATLRSVFPACFSLLQGLPAFLVGVQCPLPVVLQRRAATGYPTADAAGNVPPPVLRWQEEVHKGMHYDLTLDTAALTGEACLKQLHALLYGV